MDDRISELKRTLASDPQDTETRNELERLEKRLGVEKEKDLWPDSLWPENVEKQIEDRSDFSLETIRNILRSQADFLAQKTRKIINVDIDEHPFGDELRISLSVLGFKYTAAENLDPQKKDVIAIRIDKPYYPVQITELVGDYKDHSIYHDDGIRDVLKNTLSHQDIVRFIHNSISDYLLAQKKFWRKKKEGDGEWTLESAN